MERLEVIGSGVILFDKDDQKRWQIGLPKISEWKLFNRWMPPDRDCLFVKGEYMYADISMTGEVVACFKPNGGLEWNIWIDAGSGEILKITEAR